MGSGFQILGEMFCKKYAAIGFYLWQVDINKNKKIIRKKSNGYGDYLTKSGIKAADSSFVWG